MPMRAKAKDDDGAHGNCGGPDALVREGEGLVPANSFEAVARDWVQTIHQLKVSPGHAARTLIRFEQDLCPWLGRLAIDALSALALLTVLRRVEARVAIETTLRIEDACWKVLRYGIASGLCERDPAADLRDALKPVNTRHMATVTDPKRVDDLLRLIETYNVAPPRGRRCNWRHRCFSAPAICARWSVPSLIWTRQPGPSLRPR